MPFFSTSAFNGFGDDSQVRECPCVCVHKVLLRQILRTCVALLSLSDIRVRVCSPFEGVLLCVPRAVQNHS